MALAAAALGVPSIGSVAYVKSTRDVAVAYTSKAGVLMDSGSPTTDPYTWSRHTARSPRRSAAWCAAVTGDVLEIVVDAQTGLITDWGITCNTSGFHSLGISATA
jgi:hypothetical protein